MIMKTSRSNKKRKNERTWVEAATLALQSNPRKMFGLREILQTIHSNNLKDISLSKSAENVLATMLNQHMQLPYCPFYRVEGRVNQYALKESMLKKQDGFDQIEENQKEVINNDTKSLDECSKPSCVGYENREKHAYSIQGKSLQSATSNKYILSHPHFRKKNSFRRASSLNSRRHSSPVKLPFRSSVSPRRRPIVTRAASLLSRYSSLHSNHYNISNVKSNSMLDLESPSSVLVHANMRTLVNKETFSLLPPAYRFQLTQLLPDCDQTIENTGLDEHKIIVPTSTALTNEFFTQATQEWKERLTDGEFTRETQSRIMQEIAKERSKIDPWKEKFFEEYYGQKKSSNKRLRSRSQNLAAEAGHKMRDLGMEAQLALFAHLRPELDEDCIEGSGSASESMISDEDDELPLQKLISPHLHPRSHLPSQLSNITKQTTNLSIAKHRDVSASNKIPVPCKKPNSIVMRPTWSLITAKGHNLPNEEGDGDVGDAVLNVRKSSGEGVIGDHSYTPTPWRKISSTNHNPISSGETKSRSSTLVLCPSGQLVHSIANLKNHQHRPSSITDKANHLQDDKENSNEKSVKVNRSLAAVKPGVHVISTCPVPSETERVLSLCARPLTPESFVSRGSKSTGVISNVAKQVQSPLVETSSAQVGSLELRSTKSGKRNIHQEKLSSSKSNAAFKGKSEKPSINICSSSSVSSRPAIKIETPVTLSQSNHSVSKIQASPLLSTSTSIIPSLLTLVSSNASPEFPYPATNPLNTNPANHGVSSQPRPVPRVPLHNDQIYSPAPLQQKSSISNSNSHSSISHFLPNSFPSHPLPASHPSSQFPNLQPMIGYSQLHSIPSLSYLPSTLPSNLPLKTVATIPPPTPQISYHQSRSYPSKPLLKSLPETQMIPFYLKANSTFSQISLSRGPLSAASQMNSHSSFSSHPMVMSSAAALLHPIPGPTLNDCSKADSNLNESLPPNETSSNCLDGKKLEPIATMPLNNTPAHRSSHLVPASIVSSRPSVAGIKRSLSSSSPSGISPRENTSSNESPSPVKKTRTLAEIKLQLKAKKAAANIRTSSSQPEMISQQSIASPAQLTTNQAHIPNNISPMKTETMSLANNYHTPLAQSHVNPAPPHYIQLPSKSTLPLEKLQWVNLQRGRKDSSGDKPDISSSESNEKASSIFPKANCRNKTQEKGKITLKIKAAGSAISLKVDADVIKKEMKRGVQSGSSDDDDLSTEESNSDYSDSDRRKMFKHHDGPIRLPKVTSGSSDTDSDFEKPGHHRRWTASADVDSGQNVKRINSTNKVFSQPKLAVVPTSSLTSKSLPVFGEAPFNVSMTSRSSIMSSSSVLTQAVTLQRTPSSLFSTTPPWNVSKSNSNSACTTPTRTTATVLTSTAVLMQQSSMNRSVSKGKNMENMQKLARTDIFESDDSSGSSDEDKDDSILSSSTRSEKVSSMCSDSDDEVVNAHRHAEVTKRPIRTPSNIEENKTTVLTEMTSANLSDIKST